MPNKLRRLFTSPIFENEEKTRISQLMMNFSWIAMGVISLLLVSRLFSQTDQTIAPTLILTGMIVIIYIVQEITKRGYVRVASLFILFSLWISLTYLAAQADGVRDIAILGYVIVILLASFLVGWKSVTSIGIISLLTIWYFAFAEYKGWRALHIDTPINYARDLSGAFFLIGALIYLLVSGWQRTLQASRTELKERLRAEENLQRQADYLTALHETALGLLNRSELMPLLKSILIRACDLLNTEHGLIELVLPDGSALRQEVGHGILSQFNGSTTLRNEGVTGTVWASGQSIIVQDYLKWEKSIPGFISTGFRAVLGVPLIVENQVIGVLAVSYAEPDRVFSSQQTNLMERFAALAALAIHNTRLNEQVQNELNERKAMEVALRESEERFRKVFQASPVAICITTLNEGRLLDANDSYWKMSGYDPKTSIGKTSEELVFWDSPEERRDFVARIKIQRSIYNPDYEFTTTQEEPRAALAFYELIDLKNQVCVLSMFYDVTAQRQAELALRESEARIHAILSAIPDMIFEVSKEGTLLGYIASSDLQPLIPPEQFLGQNISELFSQNITSQTMFAIERALSSGQLHAFEYGLPPGEEIQFFEARVTAITKETVIIMIRDISQRKWVETERETLIQELETKNAELEQFTYTVSHDLKSPLITIKGFLGFLEQDAINGNTARLKTDIKRISDATEKMQSLLSELLELSRIGRLINPIETVPLNELIDEAVELVQGRLLLTKADVKIQKDLPRVFVDRRRIVETLQNLIDNAAKFCSDQTNPLIEIGQEGYEDTKPIFFVRDNGMGIEPEHHDRIFGLFNKLNATTEGTGIGLTLVKRIIEIHNGRIWVKSEPGKGATFYFTLQTGPEA
ncbi:MAG: ATP-binding protein [Anaerolineales bacterium]